MSIFEAFETPKDLRDQYETSPCTAGVMGLKTLNVICGPNNSGKSRLLRALVQSLTSTNWAMIASFDIFNDRWRAQWSEGLQSLAKHLNRSPLYTRFVTPIDETDGNSHRYNKYLSVLLGDVDAFGSDGLQTLQQDGFDAPKARTVLQGALAKNDGVSFSYIPAIRSCRDLRNTSSILEHISHRYFRGGLQQQNLFAGQELYEKVKAFLLGRPAQRQLIQDFEALLSEQFFDGRAVSLSPRQESGRSELHIRIEPEHERPISELGDGMQSIIIQLAPAFLSEGRYLALFIEEPELYLHPGLQRRLFEVLLDLDKHTHWERHQVFVTSHSNHLLDLTLDHERIAILRVEKTVGDRSDDQVLRATAEEYARFKVEMVAPGEIRLLHDLGVQSSSVFLSNCTIWVEGPTDRIILRRYMELVAKEQNVELREDLDYSFVFYAGSVAKHLSLFDDKGPDVNRICSHMLFVADYDGEKKAADAETLKEKLGDRFHRLECREIENTVSSEVLRRVVAAWTKSDPEKLELLGQDEIAEQGIGELINDHYAEFLKERDRWADEDGGLSQKRKTKFAELVREHTGSVADLSPAALAVAEAAVAFVRDHRAAANAPAT
ncbi:MAG: ATP-binding protein [Phycisphaerales bacterium]